MVIKERHMENSRCMLQKLIELRDTDICAFCFKMSAVMS